MFGVEHLTFGDPWRHQDRGHPVTGAVEREPVRPWAGGVVRRRHRGPGGTWVIGAARLLTVTVVNDEAATLAANDADLPIGKLRL